MRALIALCLTYLFWLPVEAQKPKVVTLHVAKNNIPERISVPYSGIEIVDARFDQTKIGCIFGQSSLGYSLIKNEAVFPSSIQEYLPQVLLNILETDSTASQKLVILLKRFRIADYYHTSVIGFVQPQLTLSIAASFYTLKKDSLVKLFSVDDVLSTNSITGKDLKEKHLKRFEENSFPTRGNALITMLAKALNGQQWTPKNTAFKTTKSALEDAIKQRFAMPIYSTVFQPGIYKSFQDFKESKPSPSDIQVIYKKDKIDKILVDKKELASTEGIWGLCDGKRVFAVFRKQLYELIPTDKSFQILSYRTIEETRGTTNYSEYAANGLPIIGALTKMRDNNRVPEYFDLNMETGTFFLEELIGTSTSRKEFFK